ncbi:unnamed protein product [Angiostrongylus costaricensis]|uniref:Chromo domain-containing protein n=1 Tax=Angiostrongylus costaricensis TaxID=334426 RepID=A0A0R3PWN3_ANGCS|nr:unnamed protein product [Angiostrongylus costaricensis]
MRFASSCVPSRWAERGGCGVRGIYSRIPPAVSLVFSALSSTYLISSSFWLDFNAQIVHPRGRETLILDSLAKCSVMQYNVGDHVRCIWGAKSVEYEAKIIVVNRASKEYFVHYQGWNKRYDEWISEKSVLGLWKKPATVVGAPKIRHSKREKKTRRPVDWSPTPTSSRVTEKVISVKVDCKPSVRVPKPKRSPTVRVVKRPRLLPVPKFVDESAEESITSDDEDSGARFPRSYIDTLAKQRKREERKRYRHSSPKQAGDLFKSSWKSSQPRNVAGEIPLLSHIPSTAIDTANNLTAAVSSTLAECLDFSYIEADYNYSSLRFHYSDAQSFNVRNDSNSAQVTSSTKRMNILPLRKPLNVQCKLACCAPLNLFMKASSVNLEPHQKLDTPPNLGSPFNYDEECRHIVSFVAKLLFFDRIFYLIVFKAFIVHLAKGVIKTRT